MRTTVGLTVLACMVLSAACGGASDDHASTPDTGSQAPSSGGAAGVPNGPDAAREASVTAVASAATVAATGVTTWQVQGNGTQYTVTGLGVGAARIAEFQVQLEDPEACDSEVLTGDAWARRAATIVRVGSPDQAQALDCSGAVLSSSFDEDTQALWAALSTDATDALPATRRPQAIPGDFYCPSYLCGGCERKTDVNCYGVVEICVNHNGDCTKSKPFLCGVCFGFSW